MIDVNTTPQIIKRRRRALSVCESGDDWKKFRVYSTMLDQHVLMKTDRWYMDEGKDSIPGNLVLVFSITMKEGEGLLQDGIMEGSASTFRYTPIGNFVIYDDENEMIANIKYFAGNMLNGTWTFRYSMTVDADVPTCR